MRKLKIFLLISTAFFWAAGVATLFPDGTQAQSTVYIRRTGATPTPTPTPPAGITVGNATEDAYFAWYEDSRTFSHNNNGDYLIVAVATGFDDNTEPSGVTYNGVSMTRIEGVALSGYASFTGSLWGLVNPASGANNVVVSFANEQISLYCVAVSFDGVHQSVPTGTVPTPTLGTDNAPTITASSAEGDLIVGLAFVYYDPTPTVWTDGTGNTRIHEGVTVRGSNEAAGIVSVKDGATTSTAISWTDTEGVEWGVVAVALKPAS